MLDIIMSLLRKYTRIFSALAVLSLVALCWNVIDLHGSYAMVSIEYNVDKYYYFCL